MVLSVDIPQNQYALFDKPGSMYPLAYLNNYKRITYMVRLNKLLKSDEQEIVLDF